MKMISKVAVQIFALVTLALASSGWAQSAPQTTEANASPAPASAAATAGLPLHFAPGTVLPAKLDKSIDAKKAHQGDPVIAKIDQDLLSNGKVVLPRNSKVMGHVTEAKASTKESKDSLLGIVFDKIVVKDGPELPLSATLQAIAAPISINANNGGYGDMGAPDSSNPTGMNGSSPMGGGNPESNRPSSAATVDGNATGGMPTGQASQPLARTFQGVKGLKGLSLSQGPKQDSVVTSQEHNVKLESGTQILLRTK